MTKNARIILFSITLGLLIFTIQLGYEHYKANQPVCKDGVLYEKVRGEPFTEVRLVPLTDKVTLVQVKCE